MYNYIHKSKGTIRSVLTKAYSNTTATMIWNVFITLKTLSTRLLPILLVTTHLLFFITIVLPWVTFN